MPFALVTIGLIMIVTGAKGTYSAFGKQVASDFTGEGNFLYWIASIGAVGALGYVPDLKTFSRMFMTLIVVAMVLRNGGVFDQFTAAMRQGPTKPDAAKLPSGNLITTSKAASDPVSQTASVLGAPDWLTAPNETIGKIFNQGPGAKSIFEHIGDLFVSPAL